MFDWLCASLIIRLYGIFILALHNKWLSNFEKNGIGKEKPLNPSTLSAGKDLHALGWHMGMGTKCTMNQNVRFSALLLPILTPAFLFWHRIKIACAFLVCCVCVCASVHAMWHMLREVTTLKWSFNRKIWMWVVIHLEASQICHHSILCWTKAKLQATFLKLQLFKNQIEEAEEEEEEEKIFHAFSYFAHLANLWNA